MGEARVANPLVDQFRRGGVPEDLRLLAAQGALPLTPADLVDLVLLLLADPSEAVRTAAESTLRGFPASDLGPIAKDRGTAPEVLAWILASRPERDLRESVLQNTSTHDEDIEQLVGGFSSELAELVVINQTRLLRRTPLLEALEANPSLSNDQKRRLRELRESFHIGAAPPPAAAPSTAPPPVPAVPAPQAPAAVAREPEPAPIVEETLDEDQAVARYLTDDERNETQKVNAVQRIFRLNTAQKVILALKGSREERTVLIRDPNRMVASAVLGSPRLTEAEVDTIAGMRNVSDEVLRAVGQNRDWTKRYSVVVSLVKNPRTPIAVSIGLVARLNPRDLRLLATDRNVSEVVRRQAQNFVRTSAGGAR